MNNQLFIPEKIKAGFVKREDTYEKKLAYVIYYDAKGVLRKEKSWQSWRDKKIDPVDLDNVPHSGFTLNKDVHRGGGGWFGVGRNHIRIHDDRGIEFEISPQNLIFILMNTNCVKRSLEGEFVYAWDGTDLVLLPATCEEYKKSKGFSDLQGQKILAKSMVPGLWYKTKKEKEYLYLGKYDYYDYLSKREKEPTTDRYGREEYNYYESREAVKSFVFLDKKNEIVQFKSLDGFAKVISDTPVEDYSDKLDIFLNSIHNSPLESVRLESGGNVLPEKHYTLDYYQDLSKLARKHFLVSWVQSGNNFIGTGYCPTWRSSHDRESGKSIYTFSGYVRSGERIITVDGSKFKIKGSFCYYSYYGHNQNGMISEETVKSTNWNRLKIKLKSQKEFTYNEGD